MTPRHLLRPPLAAGRNLARKYPRVAVGLVLGGLALLLGLELLTEAMLRRLHEVAIGTLLSHHLMSMFLFSLQFMLAFSALINALGAFYVRRDLDLVEASPTPPGAVFWARTAETAVTSAWMVEALLVPVFFAWGMERGAPLAYFPLAVLLPLPFLGSAVLVGVAVALALAALLPVRRTQDLMRFFGIMGLAVLVVLFRMLQPERLVEPGNFEKLAGYLASLHPEALKEFPSYWLTGLVHAFMAWDFEFRFTDFATRYLGVFAALLVVVRLEFALLYRRGLARFQEAPPPPPRGAGRILGWIASPLGRLPPDLAAVAVKELKVLARSPVVWTQLCLMVVIVLIYAYNLWILPLATLEALSPGLSLLVAFANVAMCGFLVVAAALRFGFPTVSLEGEGFLVIAASPLGMRRYLAVKYWMSAVPLCALAALLTGLAQALLRPPAPLAAVLWLDAAMITLVVADLALCFGAVFRDLRATNFAYLPSGPGGVGFLVAAMGYVFAVVGLQAYPAWLYRRWVLGWGSPSGIEAWLSVALLTASVVVSAVVFRAGRRRALASLESGLD